MAVPASTGIPDVNIKNIAGSAVDTGAAQLGVNLVGYAAGEDPATLVLDVADGLETGVTVREALRYVAAALAGTLSGATTTAVTIAAIGNAATPRISATVDASGNRSAITLS